MLRYLRICLLKIGFKKVMFSSYLLLLAKGKMYINIYVYEDENDFDLIE